MGNDEGEPREAFGMRWQVGRDTAFARARVTAKLGTVTMTLSWVIAASGDGAAGSAAECRHEARKD